MLQAKAVGRGAVSAFVVCLGGATEAATFRGLGALDATNFSGSGSAVTDGRVVVGGSAGAGGGGNGFVWDATGGLRSVGLMAPQAISADGALLVGKTIASPAKPAYWTAAAGVQVLPLLVGTSTGAPQATGVSADGAVIVGTSPARVLVGGTYQIISGHAVRWVNGIAQDLGALSGPSGVSDAAGVSSDGTVVVGSTSVPGGGTQAFRWTADGGMVSLGDLPGGQVLSRASAVSGDGRVVVGTSDGTAGANVFRWTADGGMVALGAPAGSATASVWDVSRDGSVIVGRGANAAGDPASWRAATWDVGHGWRNLGDLLSNEYGLDLTGWTLSDALGVSPDGQAIVGNGINPAGKSEAWLVVLPEPGSTIAMGVAAIAMVRWRRR